MSDPVAPAVQQPKRPGFIKGFDQTFKTRGERIALYIWLAGFLLAIGGLITIPWHKGDPDSRWAILNLVAIVMYLPLTIISFRNVRRSGKELDELLFELRVKHVVISYIADLEDAGLIFTKVEKPSKTKPDVVPPKYHSKSEQRRVEAIKGKK